MGTSLPNAARIPNSLFMPIYEYYCPDNHTIYQFYAKTTAQGQTLPACPANPKYRMKKLVSAFAITSGGGSDEATEQKAAAEGEDPRMEAAMNSMEKEFAGVDENDPKAMARMMRKMADLTGEKMDTQMEEVVRKLEEGADPESLEDQLGGSDDFEGDGGGTGEDASEFEKKDPKEPRHRFRVRRAAPRRDPQLYDFA
jgi:hypothetical protein